MVALLCVLLTGSRAANSEQSDEAGASAEAAKLLRLSRVSGGLVVHVGCGHGRLTAALKASDSFLVHGLDADRQDVEQARRYLQSKGLYGPVAVDQLRGERLPYVDNCVNLLVVEKEAKLPEAELLRVLVPNGVACIRTADGWKTLVKPWPTDTDQWTHYLHDPTNNAVAHDQRVGPPRHLQWWAGPRYSRHHDHMSSVSAVVSAAGRIFYIFDEGSRASIELPSRWSLIARDAFNGTLLWKRPIPRWHTQFWPLKHGPAELPRRLVAVGDSVYVTLRLDGPVVRLDAATGRTLRQYDGTAATEEILVDNGTLFLVVDPGAKWLAGWDTDKPSVGQIKAVARNQPWSEHERTVLALEADTGKLLWKRQTHILPLTLTVGPRRVYFHDGERLVALSRKDGKPVWRSQPLARRKFIRSFYAPTLVLADDVLLFSGGSPDPGSTRNDDGGGNDTLFAVDAATGRLLWKAPHPPSGYKSPEDVLVVDGLVWFGATTSGGLSGVFTGRDLHTGEVRVEFAPDVQTYWFHHRCHRAKATDRFVLTSRTGIEFVDLKKKHWDINHWVRGACLYGVLPANGLVYAPPHPCACYLESKLNGFSALASSRTSVELSEPGDWSGRWERGPAYGTPLDQPTPQFDPARDWLTYRYDAARSGAAPEPLRLPVATAWKTTLGGRLTPPVVGNGLVFVARVDQHTLHALNAADGEEVWSFTAGGRIDSPPTLWWGRVLFGCADGWVYCLRVSDGALVWRFRAAPADQRLVVDNQLESVWPVHGSVLTLGDEVFCVTGRSMFLDGGLRFLRLKAETGQPVLEKVFDSRNPATGKDLQQTVDWLNMLTALPDVLSSDGKRIYMRSLPLSPDGQWLRTKYEDLTRTPGDDAHLFCPSGFLDDELWHRSYWVFGRSFISGWSGYYLAGQRMPAGRPLVFNDTTVFGYGRLPEYYRWTTPMEYHVFAADKRPKVVPLAGRSAKARKARRSQQRPERTRFEWRWSERVPVFVLGLALAGDQLVLAGPPDLVDENEAAAKIGDPATRALLEKQEAALKGELGAELLVLSATDGKTLQRLKLDEAPVFDGLAAARGRVFVSTTSGSVLCVGPKEAAEQSTP